MKKKYLLSIKFLFCMTLLLSSFILSAGWVPKLKSGNKKSIEIDYLCYLTRDYAYSISRKGTIYRTKDNFKTYEEIRSNIPITEEVEFFEMTSETHGTLVSRHFINSGTDSSFIYTTKNGGYTWVRVMELPIPTYPVNGYSVSMFFKRKNQKLYILFGDITCHGEMNGEKWEFARFNQSRSHDNRTFEVFNDSIWCFSFGIDKFWTFNCGKTWGNWPNKFLAPFSFNMHAALGNTIQALNAYLQEHKIFEYSFKEEKWVEIHSIYGMIPQELLQLSDSILLVDYWDWENNIRRNGVYNRVQNKWNVLDTISSFFLFQSKDYPSYWVNRGSSIVAFSYREGKFKESTDYGQTWKDIIPDYQYIHSNVSKLSFNGNMGVALSPTYLLYSLDKGETWERIHRDSFCKDFLGNSPCGYNVSNQNDIQLYLTGYKTGKIVQNGSKISIEETHFTYGDSTPLTYDVSDMGVDNLYLTGLLGDSVYLFKSNPQKQLTAVASFKLTHLNSIKNGNLIQNQNWIVFALGKNFYSYNKQTKEINLVAENIDNTISNMEFIGSDSIYIGIYNVTILFDLKNNSGEKKTLPNVGPGQFNFISAQASNGRSEIIVCNYYSIFYVDLPDFEESRIDSGFFYRDRISVFRYWNGTFWAGGEKNIYKKQELSKEKNPLCFEIEWSGPNPIDRIFTLLIKVKETENISFQMFNSVGKLIHNSETEYNKGLYEKTIDFGQLANSIYYLKIISTCGNYQVLKLIKE